MFPTDSITGQEREKLYDEIWTEPMITVCKRYGISDNALRKRCRNYGIPIPQAGYWAKIRAGKKVAKPILPAVNDG